MKTAEVKNEIAWDWMRPEKITIQQTTPIEEALGRMRRVGTHHLIVMEGKTYVGLLDARDCAGIWEKTTPVQKIMRRDLPLVDENTEIKEVVEKFVELGTTALP